MKIFKYTFVFFLLTLNLRLYSTNITTNPVVINYFITHNNYSANANEIPIEDNYKPDDAGFWKKAASKTDDTYSFWFWLSNVSVLTSGLLCGLSFFLFPEWFLLLATIFWLLYILNFFVQINSPTALCFLNFETKDNFERYVRQNTPTIKSVFTYEHEYTEKNSKGEDETKKEIIYTEQVVFSSERFTPDIRMIMVENNNNKPLAKYKIDLFIGKEGGDSILNQNLRDTLEEKKKVCINYCTCKEKKHRIKRNVTWSVHGIENYMLIAVDKSLKPWHVSFCWFLLFTILPFSQFYKLWVNRYCNEGAAKITYTINDYNPPHF